MGYRKGVSIGAIAGLLALGLALTAVVGIAQDDLRPRDWLRIAADNSERFALLERMLGGFAPAMTEVRHHYGQTHEAITDGNFELAAWHWERVRRETELGYTRRPDRRANADAMFLDAAWQTLDEALATGERDAIEAGFLTARNACMACHVAEGRPYFNDQRLFHETAAFPR
jgi:hypothetical protein